MPAYDPLALLHGEQHIVIHQPLELNMNLSTKNQIVDIADKKSGALVTILSETWVEEKLIA